MGSVNKIISWVKTQLGTAKKISVNAKIPPEVDVSNLWHIFLFFPKGVRKMVVVENLLYILDTEVSSVVSFVFDTPLHEVRSKVGVYLWGVLCFLFCFLRIP